MKTAHLQFLQNFMCINDISIDKLAQAASVPIKTINKYLITDDALLSEMINIFESSHYVLIPILEYNGKEYTPTNKEMDFLESIYDENNWDKSEISDEVHKNDIRISKLYDLCRNHGIKISFGSVKGLYEDHMDSLYKFCVNNALLSCKVNNIDTDIILTTIESNFEINKFLWLFFNAAEMSTSSEYYKQLKQINIISSYDLSL